MSPKEQVAESQRNDFTLGVDIGGTKVAAGLVDAKGTILFQTRVPMPAREDAAAGFAAVERAINSVFEKHPQARASLAGIGICAPGPLDPVRGVVLNPPNLPCWRNFPLAAEGRHVSIDYNGPRCGCGKRGCIEALCSGPAIAQRARARLAESNAPSRMRELAGGNVEKLTTENVADARQAGDALAREVLEATADLLTVWLGNMIDLLEPDVIVFGGGVAQLMSEFFPRMQNELPKWSINARCCEIPLLLAKYGSDAGIAGAAALCRPSSAVCFA